MPMPGTLEALQSLATIPEVEAGLTRAREACTQLRWHNALRRRTAQAAAESRVRGARAGAALEGAEVSVDVVRELVMGMTEWPPEPDPRSGRNGDTNGWGHRAGDDDSRPSS